MERLNAVITGIGTYVPEYRLTNEELSQMVDTSDEWIMTRVGIKERRILKDKSKGASFLGVKAIEKLLEKTGVKPEEIELVICATATGDYIFPSTASIIMKEAGLSNAWGFDLSAACSGFLFGLETANNFVKSGQYKKVILVAAEKMSAITDYTDRNTCPLFGDAGGAVLIEPTTEDIGIVDADLNVDGAGKDHLLMKAGGTVNPASHETIDAKEHFVFQEGRHVFKRAVSEMSKTSKRMMEKHGLVGDKLTWLVPHQANMRIIEAVAHHMDIDKEQVMINIQKYGNTTAATLPLCIAEYESQLKKGDNIIFTTFGAGFTWGALYCKWGYDGK